MILDLPTLRGIADGTVTVVFRRWAAPRVRSGGTLRTSIGVVGIGAVEQIDPHEITEEQARAAGHVSPQAVRDSLRGNASNPVFAIGVALVGVDPRQALSDDDHLTDEEVEVITARLARLDRRQRTGPWTRATLDLIAAEPGRRAGDLADLLGRERLDLKVDIRKLKELGLTHSLEVGYRLSPRGIAYLRVADRLPAGD